MIDLNAQFSSLLDQTKAIHEKISQANFESLSRNELEKIEGEIKPIFQEFSNILSKNRQEINQNESLRNSIGKNYQVLAQDFETVQLTLLFKGRVNCSIESYNNKYPLEQRTLILGCGHRSDHHLHAGTYCIDVLPSMQPDAVIDIKSSSMNYLPKESFSKIILEKLPAAVFNNDHWKTIFTQLHRILGEGGQVQFNSMFGAEIGTNSGNMFNLIIDSNDVKAMQGKKLADLPEMCAKYNQKLKDCFATVGFEFSPDLDMKKVHNHYTVYKKANQQ